MPTPFATAIALGFFLFVAAWPLGLVCGIWFVVRLVQLSVSYNNPAVEDVELEHLKKKLLWPLVALSIVSVLGGVSLFVTNLLVAILAASTNR